MQFEVVSFISGGKSEQHVCETHGHIYDVYDYVVAGT